MLLKITSLIDCRNDVGYIMRFCNVSSQGEQCMMTLMVDLIFLVICISDRASDMKKTGTEVQVQGEMKECEKFLCFTFHTRVLFTKVAYTHEFQQTQSRMHL